MRRMATLALAAVLAAAAAPASAGETPKGDIQWVHTLEEAQALSAKDGRPVIAYFTFDT